MHPESGCQDSDVTKSLNTIDSSNCMLEEGKAPREVSLL